MHQSIAHQTTLFKPYWNNYSEMVVVVLLCWISSTEGNIPGRGFWHVLMGRHRFCLYLQLLHQQSIPALFEQCACERNRAVVQRRQWWGSWEYQHVLKRSLCAQYFPSSPRNSNHTLNTMGVPCKAVQTRDWCWISCPAASAVVLTAWVDACMCI